MSEARRREGGAEPSIRITGPAVEALKALLADRPGAAASGALPRILIDDFS